MSSKNFHSAKRAKNDLERMVIAYEDVFTFHADEMTRFRELLINEVQEYD